MEEETQDTRDDAPQAVSSTSTLPRGVMAKRIVWYIVGLIEAVVILRFVLLLLGANQGNAFVDQVYSISGFFVTPFFTVFSYTPTYGASILEPSSIVAMIVYALVGWGLGSLFTLKTKA